MSLDIKGGLREVGILWGMLILVVTPPLLFGVYGAFVDILLLASWGVFIIGAGAK